MKQTLPKAVEQEILSTLDDWDDQLLSNPNIKSVLSMELLSVFEQYNEDQLTAQRRELIEAVEGLSEDGGGLIYRSDVLTLLTPNPESKE